MRCSCTRAILAAAIAFPAVAQDPAANPMLRIEAGKHMEAVWSVSADPAGRYLVSGSGDLTVRVWELATGRLVRVLRPPAADSMPKGVILAVAISPDARTVACAGWTGVEPNHRAAIYVFDRESGVMRPTIRTASQTIAALAYSRDGRFLAAGLENPGGLLVVRTSDYSIAARAVEAATNDVDFASTAPYRIATADPKDRCIRLYEIDEKETTALRLIARQAAPDKNNPIRIRFSPDASRLAVAEAPPRVRVYSAGDLSELYWTDASGGSSPSTLR